MNDIVSQFQSPGLGGFVGDKLNPVQNVSHRSALTRLARRFIRTQEKTHQRLSWNVTQEYVVYRPGRREVGNNSNDFNLSPDGSTVQTINYLSQPLWNCTSATCIYSVPVHLRDWNETEEEMCRISLPLWFCGSLAFIYWPLLLNPLWNYSSTFRWRRLWWVYRGSGWSKKSPRGVVMMKKPK